MIQQKYNWRLSLCRAVLCLFLAQLLAAGAFAYDADEVIGRAGTRYTGVIDPDSRSAETGLGNAVADAVCMAAGTELSIIPGGLICNNLIAGDVTWSRLELIFSADEPLAVAELTPKQLCALLEQCMSHLTVDEQQYIDYEASAYDGYPQISGFSFRCDVSAPVGERISRLTDSDGNELDPRDDQTVLRVASVAGFFAGDYGPGPVAYETPGGTVLDAMASFIQAGCLTGEEDGRVKIVGSSDNTLLGDFPVVLAALTLILLVVAFRIFYHPQPSFANGFKMPPKSERFDDLTPQDGEEETG